MRWDFSSQGAETPDIPNLEAKASLKGNVQTDIPGLKTRARYSFLFRRGLLQKELTKIGVPLMFLEHPCIKMPSSALYQNAF